MLGSFEAPAAESIAELGRYPQRMGMVSALRRPTRRRGVVVGLLSLTVAVFAPASAASGEIGAFGDAQQVVIKGYAGEAMEPFITPDGQYLLFNTSNVAPAVPALQLATRIGAQTFEYQGPLPGEGVNEGGFLSGTPTMDRAGDLYFISNRSYSQTLSTVYGGQFAFGTVTGVHLVSGISGGTPGTVDFDVGVSPDGASLYVAVGQFGAGGGPSSAGLVLYDRSAGGFVRDPRSAEILRNVNASGMLTYAAASSPDGLELFFTRASTTSGSPTIYRATRTSTTRPFGTAQRIGAITGFAEAPSLSSDGSTLYFHHLLSSGHFVIERVTRVYTPAPTVTALSPTKGPASGGTLVHISGTHLDGASSVRFASVEATNVVVSSETELSAVAPASTAGTLDVTVTTPNGTSAISGHDHFKSIPTVTGVSPSGGTKAGGDTVTVTGAGFALGSSATTFKFGTAAALSVECSSSTTCTVLAPPHPAGKVDVKATVAKLASVANRPADQYTYS